MIILDTSKDTISLQTLVVLSFQVKEHDKYTLRDLIATLLVERHALGDSKATDLLQDINIILGGNQPLYTDEEIRDISRQILLTSEEIDRVINLGLDQVMIIKTM